MICCQLDYNCNRRKNHHFLTYFHLMARSPHVALLPSAGMGHLTPFLRLASALAARGCEVTFIAIQPTVSSAESRNLAALFSAFPQIHPLEFPLLPFDNTGANSTDPFYLHCEAIRRSAHLFPPLLSSLSLPLSSLIIDISLASTFIPVASRLNLSSYILFTSSATMLTLFAYLPDIIANEANTNGIGDVVIPGMPPLLKSMIPSALHNRNNLFTRQFVENGRALPLPNGILVNTFNSFEPEALAALNKGMVVHGLPPVIEVGPLRPFELVRRPRSEYVSAWLDKQPARSVVYVSFGSRTTLSREQTRELSVGLERSGCRFLWVVKSTVVDREEEGDLKELLDDGYLERVEDRGLVVKCWVEQEEVLAHQAIGAFVSHCGWNSVMEAAANGTVVVAWPRGADQRVNAGLVERSGLGLWVRRWTWDGEEEVVVRGEEIAELLREALDGVQVRESAAQVREEAGRAMEVGGSSYKDLMALIEEWRGGVL